MTEIAEEAVEIAMRIVASQKAEPFTLIEKISRALMARDERAAKIADNYECGPLTGENQDGETHYQNGAIDAARDIATAIRTHPEK